MIKTGFIGIGSQGAPMARRMVDAGYPLTVWARRPAAVDPFRDTNAILATSVAELGMACDHVGVCVVDDAGVMAICNDLVPVMRPGSLIAIHATIHPDTCRAIAAKAADRGIDVIDAPVSGGGQGAAAGTLTVMVGGTDNAVAKAMPVLRTFSGSIVHLGGIGSGQLAKLVNNSLMAANLAMSVHALDAGDTLGIDRSALVNLIRQSSGRSFAFDIAGRIGSPKDFAHGAALLDKDVTLLNQVLHGDVAAAAFHDVALPFLKAAQD